MNVVLVTGGAGFIGGAFVRRKIKNSRDTVVNIDSLTYAGNLESLASELESPRHVFVQVDICDSQQLAELFEVHQPQSVVHFAAESHVDRSISDPEQFIRTNVTGTHRLLDATLSYWQSLDAERQQRFRFLHVSTDEVYGSLGSTGKFTEDTPYAPNSPYAASKASSDHFARAYHKTYGLPVLITNCSNNYGPYQFPEKLIPLMTVNAVQGKPLPVYGNGKNVRDWLFVEDHCRAIETVLDKGVPGEVYNIGGQEEKTNLDVVKVICDVVDDLCPSAVHRPCSSLIEFVEDRPGHDQRYAVDTAKIQCELGWRPQVSFEEGIRKTVEWYIDNAEWVKRVCDGAYQQERLGVGRQEFSRPTSVPAPKYSEGNIADVEIGPLQQYDDHRGWLIELFRVDELPKENAPVMAYVSQTLPGVVRGPHEHYEQSDYFGFYGPGDFELYLWDSRVDSPTYGNRSILLCGASNPVTAIVPPGVVHAYKNVSDHPGIVFNAPNQLYAGYRKQGPVDEIRHENDPSSPYHVGEPAVDEEAGRALAATRTN